MGLLVTLFLILVNTYSSTLATAPPIKVTRIKNPNFLEIYTDCLGIRIDWSVDDWMPKLHFCSDVGIWIRIIPGQIHLQ